MTGRLTLAHLSDIHLPPVLGWPIATSAKRMLGLVNWYGRRSRQHVPATLAAIVADVLAQQPDHIAVTGDLVNLGLPAEHAVAARWLAGLGSPAHVTAVPGNHDIYVAGDAERGVAHWQTYMSDDTPMPHEPPFPFVRRLGRVALIGLNSAVPTPLFHAFGRLGSDQLGRLGPILRRLGSEGLVRVVLIHHPPLPGQAKPRSALEDAAALAEVLAEHGAELVLHGHKHRAMIASARGPLRAIPVIGVPSASLGRAHGRQTLARYNLFRIAPDPAVPIEMVERGIAGPAGPVVEIARRRLAAGLPAVT